MLAHVVREGSLKFILEIGACEGAMTRRLANFSVRREATGG